ncbi:MAG: DUF6600 domain-containing protein [Alphaproteobacteria bacterium]
MRKSFTAMFLALAPVAALTTLVPTAPVHAQQAEVSVSLFYEQLSPHGKWVEHPRWGWVWYPVAVEADWRPYTRGRWVWTEEHGWMWASNEPFGWATYHYGRWGYDEQYGWVWVPGQKWGPAWVAFRYSDQHVGWAPLPPDTLEVGASVQIDDAILTAGYYQPRWVFVETRHFVAPQLVTYVVPRERNVTFIRETRNVTNIRIQNNIVINRPIEPDRLRAVVRTEIPRVRIQEVQDARRIDVRQRNQTTINNIQVFKKDVIVTREARPPERARATERDRPRVRIQNEAVRPEDRRDGDRNRGDRDRGQPDRDRTPDRAQPERDRVAPPGQPRRDERGTERRDDTPSRTQPDRRGATPAQPATPPERGQEPRRGATPAQPAQPPRVSPGAPPSREVTPPRVQPDDRRGDRPGQPPSRADENKRGATPAQPAQPPRAAPGAPRSPGATPALPARPPQVAPGAPPSRQAPPAQGQQPQRGQPNSPPPPGQEPGKDDRTRGPGR